MSGTSGAVVGRLAITSALCAGVLMSSACGRNDATGVNALVGPSRVLGEVVTQVRAAPVGSTAESAGVSPTELMEHGWSCRVTPEGDTACSPPGRGLPVFGAPDDRPPTYLVHLFETTTSQYLGSTRMIRTDLYQGQTCPSTGALYVNLPHIGYYSCFDPA